MATKPNSPFAHLATGLHIQHMGRNTHRCSNPGTFQHHLQALGAIPDYLIAPSRLLVSKPTLERLTRLVESDGPPTTALRELMQSGGT